ncbi:MAG: diversity-generating retroelement protein Avd [Candidatus Andersenbacteria bacterium]
MDIFEIPIFKKAYELYKLLYSYRGVIPKADRYTLWQRCEDTTLDVVDHILEASQLGRTAKLTALEEAARKLNLLRVLVRLAKETTTISAKKYIAAQTLIDEIGRMLGGWLRATRVAAQTKQAPVFERL